MAPQVTTSMPCHSVVFCPWVIWALLAEILLIVIAAQPLQSIKPIHLVCCSLNFGNQFDLCLKNVSNLWTWFDIWHIWMYMNIYKPIWTYLNLSEHTWTYLNVSEHIWTYHNIPERIRMYLNIYEPIWTYQHLSKPIKTYRVYPNLCTKTRFMSMKWVVNLFLIIASFLKNGFSQKLYSCTSSVPALVLKQYSVK